MSIRGDQLEQDRKAAADELRAARLLQERAEGGGAPLTDAEQKTVDAALAKARAVSDRLAAQRHDDEVYKFARELSDEVGLPPVGGSGALSTKGRRLSFASMGAAAARKIKDGAPAGAKALATSGTVVTEQTFVPDPYALGKPILSLLAAIPVAIQGEQFAYLRQSVRTNLAAVVPEGQVKPTSVYTVVKIADQLDVVAHLSEAVPRLWLADNASLESFLSMELEFGLQVAVEAMIIADIAGTSGVQTQAYSTSVLQTLRKTLTKLETSGYVPEAIAINPTDFEAIELALSTVNAVEYQGLPYSAADRRLWGTPLVVSNAVAAGVSYSLAQGAVGLNTDSLGVQIAWSETSNSDDWSRNLIRARAEGRYATSVFQPMGIVVGDLTP